MRAAFIETLCDLAEERSEIVLLCGDLGFSVLEIFAEKFPDRYYNVGIAEQNMTGLAAGLAMSGKTVVTYSIANFAVVRCLEQLRNDVCYHNGSVIVVSVGTGTAYGSQGYTHHGIEDVAFTRVLPNMAVVSPGDPIEVRWAVRALIERRGPANLRLGRGGEPLVHNRDNFHAVLGKAIMLRPIAEQVTFLSSGVILSEVVAAADELTSNGIKAGVLSIPCVQPLDIDVIKLAARRSSLLVSVEEHVPEGFGGAVAEVVAGMSQPRARLLRLGVRRNGPKEAANQAEIRRANELDAVSLVARVRIELSEINDRS